MAFLSPVGVDEGERISPRRIEGEEVPLLSSEEQMQRLGVITKIFMWIAERKDEANFVLPVTEPLSCVALYAFRNRGWTVLALTLIVALQIQLLVSMNTSPAKREIAHEAMTKIALSVFMIFWFTYMLNASQHWAQDLMLIPTLIAAACFFRQLYDDGVKMHNLITNPSFKALDSWGGKTIAASNEVPTLRARLKANGIISTCVQHVAWGAVSAGLLVAGDFVPLPGRFLTNLTGWLIAGKAIASPLSVLLLSTLEYEKQMIDLEWKKGKTQNPVLNRTVQILIPVTGALEALTDVTAAVSFVYSIKQSAFKVAAVSGGLLAWKAAQTWQSLMHRTLLPIDENVILRAKRVAWVCTSFFGLAIPAYTITQAVLNRDDPLTIATAANILAFSFLTYFASKAVQMSWTPKHQSHLLRWCRYLLSEYPAVWAYVAAACNHAGKVPGMPLRVFWQMLGWMAQAGIIGLNIADIDDFLHDPQQWKQPRLGALAIMYNVAWGAQIPEVFN